MNQRLGRIGAQNFCACGFFLFRASVGVKHRYSVRQYYQGIIQGLAKFPAPIPTLLKHSYFFTWTRQKHKYADQKQMAQLKWKLIASSTVLDQYLSIDTNSHPPSFSSDTTFKAMKYRYWFSFSSWFTNHTVIPRLERKGKSKIRWWWNEERVVGE